MRHRTEEEEEEEESILSSPVTQNTYIILFASWLVQRGRALATAPLCRSWAPWCRCGVFQ